MPKAVTSVKCSSWNALDIIETKFQRQQAEKMEGMYNRCLSMSLLQLSTKWSLQMCIVEVIIHRAICTVEIKGRCFYASFFKIPVVIA